MIKYFKYLSILLVFSLVFAEQITLKNLKVIKVVDGDTIHVLINDNKESVRLIGINSPEIKYDGSKSEPYSIKAKKTLDTFLIKNGNSKVNITFDTNNPKDKWGRYLANVYRNTDNAFAQKYMLEKGLAYVYIFPDSPFKDDIKLYNYEEIARSKKLGIWTLPKFQTIKPEQTFKEFGNYAFVEGVVKNVYISEKSVWLNFGTPQKDFAARLKAETVKDKKSIQELKGKKVIIRGFIENYNNVPVMNLMTTKSIQIAQ